MNENKTILMRTVKWTGNLIQGIDGPSITFKPFISLFEIKIFGFLMKNYVEKHYYTLENIFTANYAV